MLRINTNYQSLFAQNAFSVNNSKLNLAMARLATGSRINRAADDAAGLSIMETLSAEIKSIEAASRNTSDGMSLIDTADGALDVIGDNLQEIRSLAVQASNGTLGADERAAIQAEIDERLTTISDIADGAEFNDINLLDGSGASVDIQSGTGDSEITSIDASGDFSSDAGAVAGSINEGNTGVGAGTALNDIDVTTGTGYDDILSGIDNAIANVSEKRSDLGATYSRLESSYENLDVKKSSYSAARSRIADADMALQSSLMIQSMINRESSAAMLSQSNLMAGLALNLLPR